MCRVRLESPTLSIRCEKVNVPEGSSHKLSNWLRYKIATINPKDIDDRCFQYAFPLTQLRKFLSKLYGDRFCLNCFCNFQTNGKLKQHEKLYKNRDYIKREMLKKFETVLNAKTNKNEIVP